jgi:hypothetical protein
MRYFSNGGRCAGALASILVAASVLTGCSPGGDGAQGERNSAEHAAGTNGHHAAATSTPAGEIGTGAAGHGHGDHHGGPAAPRWEELPQEVRARLTHQLALTRRLLDKFKTVADAEAAGYRRRGSFTPGMGVHYSGGGVANTSGTLSDAEILRPTHLIFDGTEKTARLAGFMYISGFNRSKGPIEGFAGPYDAWHGHKGMCNKWLPNGEKDTFGADGSITKEQCDKVGGTFEDAKTAMVHVWTVPGFESPSGVFSGLNPALTCRNGTRRSATGSGPCAKP